uniref:phosphopyruvate hydratase n=1 Tax=Schistosoma haematobium TaxID=6185 RepID=A0A094ZP69_SCHHA
MFTILAPGFLFSIIISALDNIIIFGHPIMSDSISCRTFGTELLDNLFIIKTKLSQTLMNKPNLIPQLICDNGASSVNIDKPEQAFDLLIEFLEQIQLNNHFYFGLFISPKGIFDTIKERYEIITGNLKTPEELVNYYIDLIGRYPQIRLLIDPFRVEDKEYWELLKTRITSSILITTSTIIQPAMKEITLNRSNSMITKNLKTITTLSSFDEPLKFSIPTGLTIYDLVNSCQGNKVHHHKDDAIGLGIDFIKITGLNRIDQMNKLITWYHYYQDIIDHLKDSINEWKLYDSSLMENSFNSQHTVDHMSNKEKGRKFLKTLTNIENQSDSRLQQ